jgi:hypothetical protein
MEILYETHHSDRSLDRRRRSRERAIPQSKPGARPDFGHSGAGADIEQSNDAANHCATGDAGTAGTADCATDQSGAFVHTDDTERAGAQPTDFAAKIDRTALRTLTLKCGLLAVVLIVAVAPPPAGAQFLDPSPAPGPTLGSPAPAPSSTFGDPAKGPDIGPPLGKQTPYVPPPDTPLPTICCNGVRPPSLAIPPFP